MERGERSSVSSMHIDPLAGRVLVLNQSYEPLTVCSPKKAMILLYLQKAEMVSANQHRVIRTVNKNFNFPSVIRLNIYIRVPYRDVEISRKNIMRRDNNTCQYCGSRSNLTIDHVHPRSRGGEDTWENLTTACVRCNNRKGNRTPQEANMKLQNQPIRPNYIIFLKNYIGKIEEDWKQFLFC